MKFLLIKTSSFGDIIHTFPAFSYLRGRFPQARIDWVVEKRCASLLHALPGVDNLLIIESGKWRKSPMKSRKQFIAFKRQLRSASYDFAFDLQGNIKSGLLLGLTKAAEKIGFGWRFLPEWPAGLFSNRKVTPPLGKNIREEYLFLVQSGFGEDSPLLAEEIALTLSPEERRYLEHLPERPYRVLVAPGAHWRNKELPFAKLLIVLKEIVAKRETFFLFSWGTERERALCQKLSENFPDQAEMLDHLSLPLLQNVMAKMDLVVAMDSLPLHLCGTTKTASLSFFGPSRGAKYGPIGSQHLFIQKECPYGITFEGRCPKLRSCKTGACLKDD